MASRYQIRKQLLDADLPASNSVREKLQDYLSRTGLTVADFAHRINYSAISVRFFMAGTYEKVASTDRPLRAAISDFLVANPIGGNDSDSEGGPVYQTENFRLLRRYFYEALDRARAYYEYGPPGTQKTFILQHLVGELNRGELMKNAEGRRAAYVYCRSGIRPTDLLKRVAEAFGSLMLGNADRILRNLRYDLRKRRCLVIFDEAQHLDVECLETIRELLDRPPYCGLLFAGSHDLKQMFQKFELEQWRSRLHAGKALPGISDSEAYDILTKELGGRCPDAKKLSKLVDRARVADPRQGKDYSYISARRLFWVIRDIKAGMPRSDVEAQGA